MSRTRTEQVPVTAPTLGNLLNDPRLVRLFSHANRCCALQVWILQIKSDNSTENRVIYGRLLPYIHATATWSASDRDAFESVGAAKAQVVRLNLYHSTYCSADLVRGLSSGKTIAQISQEMALHLPDALNRRFGTAALMQPLAFRPVGYLLNRAGLRQHSPTSPHESAGALSASITPLDKVALLRVDDLYEAELARLVVRRLKDDTGMEFGGADSARLGDLECLVFPTLDDSERSLLTVHRTAAPPQVQVRFLPSQLPGFADFHCRLCITNDRDVVYTAIAPATRDEAGIVECTFSLETDIYAMTDTAEVEVFGKRPGDNQTSILCCRWRMGYLKEISLQTNIAGPTVSPIDFDWLKKTTQAVAPERIAKALTINLGHTRFSSQLGGRVADPWVRASRDLDALLRRLHPPKSDGGFFPRWAHSNGEGRLRFLEWLRAILARHPRHQVAIFDPYFEASGLALLLLGRTDAADYLVFTSVPKQPSAERPQLRRKSDSAGRERLQVLLSSCRNNAHLFGREFRLRVYGMKEGWLHDRYILIMGPDGLPVAGYNLSNSLQMVSENFPLLVTPIPADALLEVEKYKANLLREAHAPRQTEESEATIALLFDSATLRKVPVAYNPLACLDRDNAGDVLSAWIGEPALAGLHGETLADRLRALGHLQDGSMTIADVSGLQACLAQRGDDFTDFAAAWEVISELLASSPAGDSSLDGLDTQPAFLSFLGNFLQSSFSRAAEDTRGPTIAADSFRESLESFLHSGQRPEHYYHPTKYGSLTWPDYFAIRILWTCSPVRLLDLVNAKIQATSVEELERSRVALALLSQVVSETALSLSVGITEAQRDGLLASPVGLLRWMGWHAIEQQVLASELDPSELPHIAGLTDEQHLQMLGWMVQRAARDSRRDEAYAHLISELHQALPERVPAPTLAVIIDAMRGHMGTLPWAEPWLFNDVLLPLLRGNRASVDDAGDVWMRELATLLGPVADGRSRLFGVAREGQTTNVAAALFAESTPDRQSIHLQKLRGVLKQQRRVLQQPLASTSDWARWDDALTVCLWLHAFALWATHYQRTLNKDLSPIQTLANETQDLVALRPHEEWSSDLAITHRDLLEFAGRADALLKSAPVD